MSLPFLSFIMPILTRNVSFTSPVFKKRWLVFPTLLFYSISLHCSLKKALFSLLAILWNSAFSWVSFPLSLASLFCSFQSLTHVRLFVTHGLQHTRIPCPLPVPRASQTHIHWVSDATQPSHPVSSPSPPDFNLSQHQAFCQWVSSSHKVAKVLQLYLQRQFFQWIFRGDCL